MWILESEKAPSEDAEDVYYLPPGVYTVGRKDADIVCNHKSVSRKHAIITVKTLGASSAGLVLLSDGTDDSPVEY